VETRDIGLVLAGMLIGIALGLPLWYKTIEWLILSPKKEVPSRVNNVRFPTHGRKLRW